jgi:hypothetical protein
MHDDGSAGGLAEGRISDPLRHAPEKGRWVLWHGPQAQRTVELCRQKGSPLSAPIPLPPLPKGFPPPLGETVGEWLLAADGRRFYVRAETQSSFVSCLVLQLPE